MTQTEEIKEFPANQQLLKNQLKQIQVTDSQ